MDVGFESLIDQERNPFISGALAIIYRSVNDDGVVPDEEYLAVLVQERMPQLSELNCMIVAREALRRLPK